MVSFELWVHIHVNPPIKGWAVHVYWRSPDPMLVPPYTWVGPIAMTTDATGEAYFQMGVTYTSPEYYPIPIRVVIPVQAYPGPAYQTYGGLTFERYEGPEWQVVGWSYFHKDLKIYPRKGKSADIVVRGKVIGGYPKPDMTLEILINGSPVASRAIPGASIGTSYELAGLLNTPGTHQTQGRMVLSNPLGSPSFSSGVVPVEILSESIVTAEINPNWDDDVGAYQDPDSTVRDSADINMLVRNLTDYRNWGLLRFDIRGFYGITEAEFGAYCYESVAIDSGDDTLLLSNNPWPDSFRKGDLPASIATVGSAFAKVGQWFKTSAPALVSYLNSRVGDQAYFRLYCVGMKGEIRLLKYYTKEGAYKPYLKLTYKKYA